MFWRTCDLAVPGVEFPSAFATLGRENYIGPPFISVSDLPSVFSLIQVFSFFSRMFCLSLFVHLICWESLLSLPHEADKIISVLPYFYFRFFSILVCFLFQFLFLSLFCFLTL